MNFRFLLASSAGVALIICSGFSLGLAQAPGAPPFAPAETLTYEVDWSIFRAGKIVAQLVGSGAGTGPAEIITTARTQGVASLLYKVQDDFHSFFNPETLCSQRISKKVSEGGRRREINLAFNGEQGVAVVDERDLNTPNAPPKHAEKKIPACVEDIVTAFYYLRRQPLHVGQEIRLAVDDGGDAQEVTAEVQAQEQLQTALGTRQAIRVEPRIFGPLYKKKGRLLVWFSDDQEHLPLRIRATLSVGTITANLQSITSQPNIGASPR